MSKQTQPTQPISSVLVFGVFTGAWAWRVEWQDAGGRLHSKDFHQKDLRPGEAKAMADTFQVSLNGQLAA